MGMEQQDRIPSRVFRASVLVTSLAILGSGKTASAQAFNTTYNLPGDTLPASVGSNTRVNVNSGGSVTSYSFGASNGSVQNVEVNLNSGSTGNNINFYDGATLNAFDGTYIDGAGSVSLNLNNGSVVNQSGGRILAGTLSIKGGSQYNLSGGTMGYDPDRLDHGQLDVTGELNVTGGLVNALGDVSGSGVVNVSGGEVRLEREVKPT